MSEVALQHPAVLLEARDVRGGYGGAEVVCGADVVVRPGRTVAILGPNGAGKSTLVRLMAGILAPSAGRVELLGRPLVAWRRREVAARVALVPQLVEFAFPLTVHEVVEQGRAPHLGPWRPPTERDNVAVSTALARVGLGDRAGVSVRELSGGERQLVLLARALATEPRVLLLDEPASALDVRHQLDLVAILRDLLDAEVGVLVVLHDWNLALKIADDLVVLRRGRMVASGPTDQLVTPELFETAFAVDVDILRDDANRPIVVPRQGC